MSKHHEIDPKILAEAIDWCMLQTEQELSAMQQTSFELWKNQSQQHQLAWQRTEKLQQRLSNIPNQISKNVLEPKNQIAVPFSKLILLFAAGGLIIGTAYMAEQHALLADYRTPYGEQRSITLEDGTKLKLNSKTAIDVNYTTHERKIILHYGEIFIETAKESNTSYRPFKVLNTHGSIQALGTHFNVAKEKQYTSVTVLEHAVKVNTSKSNQNLVLSTGQQVSFDTQQINKIKNAEFEHLMWRKGLIIAHRMKLKDFAAQLSNNYGVKFDIADDIENLQISGTYPTDNLDRLLATLNETYGLQSKQNFFNTQINISSH